MIINTITTILNFRFPLFFSIKPNRTIGLFHFKPLKNQEIRKAVILVL